MKRLAVLVAIASPGMVAAAPRTTLMVRLDAGPSWRDLAYLAAIPASQRVNAGGPSLIADDGAAGLDALLRDTLRRYRPDRIVRLGDGTLNAALPTAPEPLVATNADDAARVMSRRFWKTSRYVVICDERSYALALVAAPVAARLGGPLLFARDGQLSAGTREELRRLDARQTVWIGAGPKTAEAGITVLPDAERVLEWFGKRGQPVRYLAAVNPQDREHGTIRKLSLLGAQFAAGRGGLLVPLDYAVQWKRAMPTTAHDGKAPGGKLPTGVAPAAGPIKRGSIDVGGAPRPFWLTRSGEETELKLYVELDPKGAIQGPYVSGDEIELNGKPWAISLGTRTKFGQTEVHLTWPTAGVLTDRLAQYYRANGGSPEHLCLVGFPDSLPHAIIGKGGIVEEQASDLPFAMTDSSGYPRIGVGRIIAESVGFGSLLAARSLAYGELQPRDWIGRASQAEWENSLGPLFENVGYARPHHLRGEDVPWTVPPKAGEGGTRAASFSQDSPLAESAVLAHSEHSWWRGLGSMFNWDADVTMAPTIVESGGCGTACLDREADNRSVVARLLRVGAVSFAGGSRELSAQAQVMRSAYWNGVLAGKTLGQAHRDAQFTSVMTIRDLDEGPGGAYRYNTQVRMLFGDPALRLRVPSKPISPPARTVHRGDTVTVHAPAKWSTVKMVVPPDWKDWAGKDLYVIRGAGSYTLSHWGPDGHDVETSLVNAEFTTSKPVTSIRQITTVATPLGWRGKWHSVRNADGTYTTRFAVQMVDFDAKTGKIRRQVDAIRYRLVH
ncbi:MAG: hypothetical protein SFX74_13100 [Fimbriimonadaceae bacterium]|nr:hypothetical protein [Fimbriimonadaceae bacterium]